MCIDCGTKGHFIGTYPINPKDVAHQQQKGFSYARLHPTEAKPCFQTHDPTPFSLQWRAFTTAGSCGFWEFLEQVGLKMEPLKGPKHALAVDF